MFRKRINHDLEMNWTRGINGKEPKSAKWKLKERKLRELGKTCEIL